MALSKTTQDHDTIRKWAEARGAQPAEVRGTHKGNQTGILRFCFPKARNRNDENLQEISWDEFFEKFDDNGLELIYQDKTAGGAKSNFNKLIYPEDEHASGRGGSRSSARTSATSSRSASSGSASRGSKTRSISSGRGNSSSSSSRGSTQGKSTKTGRGSSSSRTAGSSSRSHSSSTRKRAA